MRKGQKMTEAQKQKIRETRVKRIAEGKFVVWNKGLTKEDPRVLRNISRGSRKTQFKKGPRPHLKGNKNPNWKGGKIIHSSIGYIFIRMPEHPAAVNSYVMEHRLVMEKHLGRYLTKDEVVHHVNHNKTDNRIENLLLMTLNQHTTLHNIERWKQKRLVE